jgi:MarR family transcriptional regulator, organic hydroperoxide resistance regulator
MDIIKGASIFLSASIDTLSGRILSKKHSESDVDTLTAAQSRILFLLSQKDEISMQEVSRITNLQNQP